MAAPRCDDLRAAVLVFDGTEGLVRNDLKIADLVTKHHKSCIVLAKSGHVRHSPGSDNGPPRGTLCISLQCYAPIIIAFIKQWVCVY